MRGISRPSLRHEHLLLLWNEARICAVAVRASSTKTGTKELKTKSASLPPVTAMKRVTILWVRVWASSHPRFEVSGG